MPFSELYSEGGRFRWCETLTEAENILSTLVLDRGIEEFVSYHPYYKTVLQGWSLQNLAESTLYFYLEDKFQRKKEYKEPLINSYDWKLITNLILNSIISKQIIEFIHFLDLLKISPTQKILAGSFQSVENISFMSFEDCIFDEKGLRNLLSFFNLENIYIDYIIHKTFETKNIKIVAIFLSDLNVSGDQGLVLTKAIEKFSKFVNTNENFIKKSEKISTKNHYKNRFEERRNELAHGQAIKEFDAFPTRSLSSQHDGKTSCRLLKEGLLRVKPILIHYDAIAPSLETGTVADLRSADKNNKLRNSIGEAITFTEKSSGQNLSHLRDSVLNKDYILSLEQAEEIARTDLVLDFVQKGVKPIWRPSTFKYPRK